jgi:peptidoglycan/LPS O-acetylase OafA/YrhL
MPEPVKGDQKYLPGLDGLRALAVAAVVAYHLGYGWAQGGLLGVGVFFTLSGYLITDILAGQWAARGRIKLGDFWLRRARRLLPALFVMLAIVTLWVNLFARSFLPGFRGNVVASVFYVSNWWFIGQHASYYARFAPATPLDHLWSLAVEEQFYLVWPWVVLLLVWLVGGRRRRRRGLATTSGAEADGGPPYLTRWSRLALAVLTLALAAGSAMLMAHLYRPGYDPTRVYEGTDTRAFGLLIGAALAYVWPTRRPPVRRAGAERAVPADRTVPAAWRWLLDAAGLAGLVVIGLLVVRTNQYSEFMFRGGLVVLSVATAATIAAVVTPGSVLGLALGCTPLRWIGVRSYGIYLWHFPVIVLTTAVGAAGGPVSPFRAVALVALTVGVAAVSWRYVEDPIRRGARLRWVTPDTAIQLNEAKVNEAKVYVAKATGGPDMTGEPGTGAGGGPRPSRGRRPGLLGSPQGIAAIGGMGVLGVAVLVGVVTAFMRLTPASAHPAVSPSPLAAAGQLSNSAGKQPPTPTPAAGKPPATGKAPATGKQAGTPAAKGKQSGTAAPTVKPHKAKAVTAGPAAAVHSQPAPPRTSCTSVVHIGDSTSEGLISPDYEPNPANRITARYADVGVKQSIMKIVGATSVVESLPGTPNAYDMASEVKQGGFSGCWVLALGTNDTADVYVGSNVDRVQRIEEMMKLIGNQPVMWVEVSSLVSSGPYSEQNMELWNQALQKLQPRYPNMRIFNWPAVVHQSWFISDGIHFTSNGYAHRATAIADALAKAFPAS